MFDLPPGPPAHRNFGPLGTERGGGGHLEAVCVRSCLAPPGHCISGHDGIFDCQPWYYISLILGVGIVGIHTFAVIYCQSGSNRRESLPLNNNDYLENVEFLFVPYTYVKMIS